MIRITDTLCICNADEPIPPGTEAVLNVAQDLRGKIGWPHIEYMQVGLVDGPGNPLAAYIAAALALSALQERGSVVVVCHGGSRSLAVVLMCLNLAGARDWDDWFLLLGERLECKLPNTHSAHREAFDKINWKLLTQAVNVK